MQGMVSNMKRLICETQAINTNAQLTWRIESVNEKIEVARSGTKPAIYSPPFFSSDAGNTHVCFCFEAGFYVHVLIKPVTELNNASSIISILMQSLPVVED